MQYWIFSIQAGIDNVELSNLIEHADNVSPSDGNLVWRKSKTYGNAFPPYWINVPEKFYSNVPLQIADSDFKNYTVSLAYRNLVQDGRNIVIPANLSYFWTGRDKFPFADLMKKDVCAIYVYSNNKTRLHSEILNTHLTDIEKIHAGHNIDTIDPLDQSLWSTLYPPGFNAVIEMDRIWTDWDYLNNTLTKLGITLSKTQYDRYLSVYKRG
jgi:hypothetical protein